MNIRDLKPGRETDALVAEQAMEWEACSPTASFDLSPSGVGFGLGDPPEGFVGRCTELSRRFVFPSYSTDIAAAWEVAKKLGIFFGRFSLGKYCAFSSIRRYEEGKATYADTPELAICIEALEFVNAQNAGSTK